MAERRAVTQWSCKRKYCLILCLASEAQSITVYGSLYQVPKWCLCLSQVSKCCFPFKGLFLHSKTGLGSEEVLQTYLEIWSVSGGLLKAYYVDQLTLIWSFLSLIFNWSWMIPYILLFKLHFLVLFRTNTCSCDLFLPNPIFFPWISYFLHLVTWFYGCTTISYWNIVGCAWLHFL